MFTGAQAITFDCRGLPVVGHGKCLWHTEHCGDHRSGLRRCPLCSSAHHLWPPCLRPGDNEEAARLSGVNVNRVKTLVYVLSGFFAALGGVIYTSGCSRPARGRTGVRVERHCGSCYRWNQSLRRNGRGVGNLGRCLVHCHPNQRVGAPQCLSLLAAGVHGSGCSGSYWPGSV